MFLCIFSHPNKEKLNSKAGKTLVRHQEGLPLCLMAQTWAVSGLGRSTNLGVKRALADDHSETLGQCLTLSLGLLIYKMGIIISIHHKEFQMKQGDGALRPAAGG